MKQSHQNRAMYASFLDDFAGSIEFFEVRTLTAEMQPWTELGSVTQMFRQATLTLSCSPSEDASYKTHIHIHVVVP